MATENINFETLLPELFKAVYVTSTPEKEHDVRELIEECVEFGDNSMSIATEICDYLGIERRHNRKEICNVLATQNI